MTSVLHRTQSVVLHRQGYTLHILPILGDNYVYIIEWDGRAAVIDLPDGAPVLKYLDQQGLTLELVLNTHPHFDHVAGNLEVKAATGCTIIGPSTDRIPGLDRPVHEGDTVVAGPLHFKVIETPGHTRNDIVYYCAAEHLLFSADTLFAGGCGRLFECTEDDMWTSLVKLRSLPDETEVFPGHEYAVDNLTFAHQYLPEHSAISTRLETARELRADQLPVVPTTIGLEKATNIFLLADDPEVQKFLNLTGCEPAVALGEIRKRKDRF
jgi:hydroxyacylglutathione hydrolase